MIHKLQIKDNHPWGIQKEIQLLNNLLIGNGHASKVVHAFGDSLGPKVKEAFKKRDPV